MNHLNQLVNNNSSVLKTSKITLFLWLRWHKSKHSHSGQTTTVNIIRAAWFLHILSKHQINVLHRAEGINNVCFVFQPRRSSADRDHGFLLQLRQRCSFRPYRILITASCPFILPYHRTRFSQLDIQNVASCKTALAWYTCIWWKCVFYGSFQDKQKSLCNWI